MIEWWGSYSLQHLWYFIGVLLWMNWLLYFHSIQLLLKKRIDNFVHIILFVMVGNRIKSKKFTAKYKNDFPFTPQSSPFTHFTLSYLVNISISSPNKVISLNTKISLFKCKVLLERKIQNETRMYNKREKISLSGCIISWTASRGQFERTNFLQLDIRPFCHFQLLTRRSHFPV